MRLKYFSIGYLYTAGVYGRLMLCQAALWNVICCKLTSGIDLISFEKLTVDFHFDIFCIRRSEVHSSMPASWQTGLSYF